MILDSITFRQWAAGMVMCAGYITISDMIKFPFFTKLLLGILVWVLYSLILNLRRERK